MFQAPHAPHVWTAFPEHCVCPGAQSPWHAFAFALPQHVLFVQSVGSAHVPASHPIRPLPEHSDCPTEHEPVHLPFTHVELTHPDGVPHWPLASQVSTALPEQRTFPGAHTPWQKPLTHA